MAQHPRSYPSECNTRVVRINAGAYALLVELAEKSRITVAQALDLVIRQQAQEVVTTHIPPTQIPMPWVRVLPSSVNSNGVADTRPKEVRLTHVVPKEVKVTHVRPKEGRLK